MPTSSLVSELLDGHVGRINEMLWNAVVKSRKMTTTATTG